jgi:hypothetical protein
MAFIKDLPDCCDPKCTAHVWRWGRCQHHAALLTEAEIERIKTKPYGRRRAEYAALKRGTVISVGKTALVSQGQESRGGWTYEGDEQSLIDLAEQAEQE